MTDFRTRRQKVKAVLHPKSGATAGERTAAQEALKRMTASEPVRPMLTREDILRQASERANVDFEDLAAAVEFFRTERQRRTEAQRREAYEKMRRFAEGLKVSAKPTGPRYRDGQKIRYAHVRVKNLEVVDVSLDFVDLEMDT